MMLLEIDDNMDLKSSKNSTLPSPEDIIDSRLKKTIKDLLDSVSFNYKNTYDDLQTLNTLLQNIDGNILPKTDDTYYIGGATSPFKAFKALILKDTTNGKHYKITSVNGALTIAALD